MSKLAEPAKEFEAGSALADAVLAWRHAHDPMHPATFGDWMAAQDWSDTPPSWSMIGPAISAVRSGHRVRLVPADLPSVAAAEVGVLELADRRVRADGLTGPGGVFTDAPDLLSVEVTRLMVDRLPSRPGTLVSPPLPEGSHRAIADAHERWLAELTRAGAVFAVDPEQLLWPSAGQDPLSPERAGALALAPLRAAYAVTRTREAQPDAEERAAAAITVDRLQDLRQELRQRRADPASSANASGRELVRQLWRRRGGRDSRPTGGAGR
ncbi:MAG: hypothetical protein QM655_09730 [Nocardioidaceae bacterium]